MALNVTISVLYLGNLADLDTNESTLAMETPGLLIGTYGSASDPLYKQRTYIETDSPIGDGPGDAGDQDDDGSVSSNNTDLGSPDTLTYDIGAGTVTTRIDSMAAVNGTITFWDGTTYTATFAVFQDTNGELFLAISDSQTTLDDKAVRSFQITSVVKHDYTGLDQASRNDLHFVACFTDDAALLTPDGERPITELKAGDLLMTRDHGAQPIRWIGAATVELDRLQRHPSLRPYRVASGTFGPGLPTRDLVLSPQHRLLTTGKIVERQTGQREALAAVRHFLPLPGIERLWMNRAITYRHVLLDRHEVIFANGLPTESLFLGPGAFMAMDAGQKSEIAMIFPDLTPGAMSLHPAVPLASGRDMRGIVRRLERRGARGQAASPSLILA
ncbi:Hint domain-containing protein [Oceanicola sp. 22II-s10i]|uniref:Hint domain-containing protein n=1 Tax=Oceanicola sp. 22II-s10i TaxID=1317116 RepID=UPI00112FD1D4|nr:Hint domain-containing protein [Oceanicola sp. 22II-s10i]